MFVFPEIHVRVFVYFPRPFRKLHRMHCEIMREMFAQRIDEYFHSTYSTLLPKKKKITVKCPHCALWMNSEQFGQYRIHSYVILNQPLQENSLFARPLHGRSEIRVSYRAAALELRELQFLDECTSARQESAYTGV